MQVSCTLTLPEDAHNEVCMCIYIFMCVYIYFFLVAVFTNICSKYNTGLITAGVFKGEVGLIEVGLTRFLSVVIVLHGRWRSARAVDGGQQQNV